jgi:hypothetical protein
MGHRMEFLLTACHYGEFEPPIIIGTSFAASLDHDVLLQTLRRINSWRTVSRDK